MYVNRIINIVGNFGTVFLDNAYWQRAIAADPKHVVKAYLMGGLAWFAIPFTLATTMGLTGRALQIDISDSDVSAGLVLPKAAFDLMGKTGAMLTLIVVFMAVTSALSAEMVAVSSQITYDIYKVYFVPDASNEQVVKVADTVIVGYGLMSGVFAIILGLVGIDLGFLYLFVCANLLSICFKLFCVLSIGI